MREVQFQRAVSGRYLNATGLEETDTFRNVGTILTQNAMCRFGSAGGLRAPSRWEASYCTQRENLRVSYLFAPVVGVSAGVCVAPDFGMTVSCMVVDGIFGL
jgi:hypothetical protein